MEQILEAFKSISDRISSYQIFTFFYPGAVFLAILMFTYNGNKPEPSILEGLLLCYTVGMIISRIGTFMEDVLVWTCAMKRIDYKKIIKAEGIDAKISMHLRISNMYRTMAALSLSVLFLIGLNDCTSMGFIFPKGMGVFCVLMIALFLYSFFKQYGYTRERVEQACNNTNNSQG